MSSALRVFAVTLCALAALILICGVLLTAALFSADDSLTGSDGSSKLLPALFILGVTSGGPLHGFASVFNFGRLPAILLRSPLSPAPAVSASSKNPVTLIKELFLRISDARRFPKSSGVAPLYTTRVRECAHTFNNESAAGRYGPGNETRGKEVPV